MAAAARAKDHSYRRYGVSGSSALDLNRLEREEALRHAGEAPTGQTADHVLPRVQAEPALQVRQKQHVSLFTVGGMALFAALCVLMLTFDIRLTSLSSETVTLQNELKTLQTENVTLTAQHEQMFDLSSVKEAAEAAGMAKPGSSQICYIDLSGGDKAVVYKEDKPGVVAQVLASLRRGACAVVDFID